MESEIDAVERARMKEERRAHLWFLGSLDRITRAMQGTNDLEMMVSEVLDVVLDIFGTDRAWLVHPCDPEAASWRLVMERARQGYAFAADPGVDVPTTPTVVEMSRIARQASGAVLFGPGHEHALSPGSMSKYQVHAQMLMALYPKAERPYAFGVHHCSGVRRWTLQERRLFEEIGHRLENALTSLLIFRKLRESERRLDEAQRLAHVGYWERDLIARTIRLSEESERIFGIAHGDVLDLAAWNELWLKLIHPGDRQSVAECAANAISGRSDYDVEYRLVRPDGEVRVVHSRGAVKRDESGQPTSMFGMMQDITELRQAETAQLAAETRFRTFVDHATDALFVHDAAGRVVDVNRRACELLGYSREELIGQTPALFDSRAIADPPFVEAITHRLDAGQSFDFETIHQRKDGVMFPVEVRTRPFWQGGQRFSLALSRDITESKRAEEERERMRLMERERDSVLANERTRLAGEIHDTLAQGLAMIVMQLADAEDKLGPHWARAEKPLNTVRELAVESLAYARRTQNMLRASGTTGGLTRAVRDVVDSLRRYFTGEVILNVRGDSLLLPAPVESALTGIAREALSNAIRHSGASEVTIEIEFTPGGGARLIVADKGVGFETTSVRPDAYGLICMNDRAIRAGVALTFVTEPGAGVEIVANWSP